MGQGNTADLVNNLLALNSLPPDETYSAGSDTNGGWVDASEIVGPVHFLCMTGAVSGSPSAQSINFVLDEADDSSGTNAQEVAVQTEVTLTADDAVGIGQAQTTKPFVRVVVDDAGSSFTGGTTPAIEVAGAVLAQKKNF